MVRLFQIALFIIGVLVPLQFSHAAGEKIPSLSFGRYLAVSASLGEYFIVAGGGKPSQADPGHSDFVESIEVFDLKTLGWTVINTPTLALWNSGTRSAIIGTTIYFVGNRLYGDSIHAFDLRTQTFSSDTKIPWAYGAGIFSQGNLLSVIGGYVQTKPNIFVGSDAVNTWDTQLAKLSATMKLSKGRGDICVATAGDRVLFGGGEDEGASNFSEVDILDAKTGRLGVTNLPGGGGKTQCASDGHKAFFLNENGQFDILELSSLAWQSPALPFSNEGRAMAFVEGKVLLAGGTDYKSDTDRIDIYEVSTGHWTTGALSMARANISVASNGTQVLFAGGTQIENGNNKVKASVAVDLFDGRTGTWLSSKVEPSRF